MVTLVSPPRDPGHPGLKGFMGFLEGVLQDLSGVGQELCKKGPRYPHSRK